MPPMRGQPTDPRTSQVGAHIFRTITRFTFCVRCNLPYRLFIGGNTR